MLTVARKGSPLLISYATLLSLDVAGLYGVCDTKNLISKLNKNSQVSNKILTFLVFSKDSRYRVKILILYFYLFTFNHVISDKMAAVTACQLATKLIVRRCTPLYVTAKRCIKVCFRKIMY